MWSLTNPIGTTTTAVAPSAATSASASATSGTSHGTCGGPLREEKTRRHDGTGTPASATPAITRSATTVCSAT
ncbi:MAG: hypothetical protein U0R65_07540 [Candidatus Nanopelagicales bacterium]